ncbi:uncharacterized protein LOC135399546 [Ornithodoros turicata]|uniref:uncharacterized protein LOC135399546 n=1 Tax=Ornithodoros turicata TaxID=34597 RepID=UPI003138DE01
MSDQKDQADANAATQGRPPSGSDATLSAQRQRKKHRKKHKEEGSKGASSTENISSPASLEVSSLGTHPRSPTSSAPPLPGRVVPAAVIVDSPIVEAQGPDIRDPSTLTNREVIERGPPAKSAAAPGVLVSVPEPSEKYLNRRNKGGMNIGIALLVGALVTFAVWVVFLSVMDKHPTEKHIVNDTRTTHD